MVSELIAQTCQLALGFREMKRILKNRNFLIYFPYFSAVMLISVLGMFELTASFDRDWRNADPTGWPFLPIAALILALPFAFIGHLLSVVVSTSEKQDTRSRTLGIIAVFISVFYISFVTISLIENYKPLNSVTTIKNLDAAGLAEFLRNDPYRDNVFALAAVAMHPDAGADWLAEIAAREDPALQARNYEAYIDGLGTGNAFIDFARLILIGWIELTANNSTRKLMGENFVWDFSVQELLSMHPNTPGPSLAALTQSPDPHVRINVATHPSTPVSAIEYLYENANEPVLDRLLEFRKIDSPDDREEIYGSYALKTAIAHNTSTPDYILLDIAGTTEGIFNKSGLSKCELRYCQSPAPFFIGAMQPNNPALSATEYLQKTLKYILITIAAFCFIAGFLYLSKKHLEFRHGISLRIAELLGAPGQIFGYICLIIIFVWIVFFPEYLPVDFAQGIGLR